VKVGGKNKIVLLDPLHHRDCLHLPVCHCVGAILIFQKIVGEIPVEVDTVGIFACTRFEAVWIHAGHEKNARRLQKWHDLRIPAIILCAQVFSPLNEQCPTDRLITMHIPNVTNLRHFHPRFSYVFADFKNPQLAAFHTFPNRVH
jgi:hypothetical protein